MFEGTIHKLLTMQCDLPLEEKQLNCKIVLCAVTKSLKRIPKIV